MEQTKFMQQTTFPTPNYEAWKQEAETTLKGKPFETLFSSTYEDITLQPLYTKRDIQDLASRDELPGFTPFTRGTDLLGYRLNSWKIAQLYDLNRPQELNTVLKHDVLRGLTMIHPQLNKMTKLGLEKPIQSHEKNKGVIFQNVADFQLAFADIDLESLPILMDAHQCSLPVFAQFLAAIKDSQDITKLTGTIGMDPIGALVEEGTSPCPLAKLYDVMASIMSWSSDHTPHLRSVLVKSDPYHNGGANAVQELAYAIATGIEYINESLNRGLSIDMIAKQITFSFSVGANIFMEIAKLRAAKVLWSTVIKEFGGNEQSQKMNIHAQTSLFTKTVYDPYVNILRGTTEAFATIIGGIDSLSVAPFDVAAGHSTDFSRRVARNIQIILQEEVHLDKVIDPAGGSWYVETLTNELAEKAWELLQQIEGLGGMSQAVQDGFIQANVADTLTKKLNSFNHRQDKMVGINYYANMKEQPLKNKEIKMAKIVLNRSGNLKELANLTEAINNNQDIVENAILAASAGASVSDIFKVIFEGEESLTTEPIIQRRITESFESIRKASEKYKETYGHLPKVGLINLGPLSKHKSRADFVTGFFEAGGFEVVNNDGLDSVAEVVAKTPQQLEVYIICGTDEQYSEFVPEIATSLKVKKLFVAGKQPAEIEKQFVEAGITGFIHLKSNCFEILKELQQEMGVHL